MTDIKILHRARKTLEGKKVDFLFLPDEEFRNLMLGTPQELIKEQKEGNIPVVLVGYPTLTSISPEGVDFPVDLLLELYSNSQ